MADLVVDTHALLWYFDDAGQLSAAAHQAIDAAARVDVVSISFWEIEMLRTKARVSLDRPTPTWRRDLLRSDRFGEISVDGAIAILAAGLDDFHGDPADRFIVASALRADCPLVTKDRKIHAWGKRHHLDLIW